MTDLTVFEKTFTKPRGDEEDQEDEKAQEGQDVQGDQGPKGPYGSGYNPGFGHHLGHQGRYGQGQQGNQGPYGSGQQGNDGGFGHPIYKSLNLLKKLVMIVSTKKLHK